MSWKIQLRKLVSELKVRPLVTGRRDRVRQHGYRLLGLISQIAELPAVLIPRWLSIFLLWWSGTTAIEAWSEAFEAVHYGSFTREVVAGRRARWSGKIIGKSYSGFGALEG